jgi:hypothetical protein
MLNKYFFYLSLLFATWIHTADTKETIHAVIIPGQNGLGGVHGEYILSQHGIKTHDAGTVQLWIDFGQKNCIAHCAKKIAPLQQNNDVGGIIILASSQGSATALGYVAQHPEKIRLIMIESMLASGNSAIDWTIGRGSIPGGYYILPYLAKLFFWSYNPTGTQAIHAVDKINTDIPIVIAHCTKDFQLAYSDAEAIYAGLHASGNKNIYLIPIDNGHAQHVELITSSSQECKIIDAILVKHNLSNKNLKEPVDLAPYQPQPNNQTYAKLIARENKLRSVAPFIKLGVFTGLGIFTGIAALYYKFMPGL